MRARAFQRRFGDAWRGRELSRTPWATGNGSNGSHLATSLCLKVLIATQNCKSNNDLKKHGSRLFQTRLAPADGQRTGLEDEQSKLQLRIETSIDQFIDVRLHGIRIDGLPVTGRLCRRIARQPIGLEPKRQGLLDLIGVHRDLEIGHDAPVGAVELLIAIRTAAKVQRVGSASQFMTCPTGRRCEALTTMLALAAAMYVRAHMACG